MQVRIPGITNLHQAEGNTSVILDGRLAGILIVSDDGMGLKRKPGHYIGLRFEGQASSQ